MPTHTSVFFAHFCTLTKSRKTGCPQQHVEPIHHIRCVSWLLFLCLSLTRKTLSFILLLSIQNTTPKTLGPCNLRFPGSYSQRGAAHPSEHIGSCPFRYSSRKLSLVVITVQRVSCLSHSTRG